MKKLSGVKISHKISRLMVGLVAGFLMMAVAYYAQLVSSNAITEANAQYKTVDQLISSTLTSAAEIKATTPRYIELGDDETLSFYRGGKLQIIESLNLLGSVNPRFVDKKALESAKQAMKQLDERIADVVNRQELIVKDAALKDSAKEELQSALVSMTSSLQDYRRSLDSIVKRRVAKAEQDLSTARTMFAAILVVTALGTTLGLFLIYRALVIPLSNMQAVIAKQNKGNESARVTVMAYDELGDLGMAFNKLLDERIKVLTEQAHENETLNNSIISLIRALGTIAKKDLSIKVPVSADVTGTISDAVNLLTSETAKTLLQVKGYSEKIDLISNELQVQSNTVLAVAEEEREQVDQTVQSLDQSARAMSDIAKEARSANSVAVAAINYTQKAQHAVIQTVEGIQTIRGTLSETEKRIKRLGDRSQEITGIVNLINTIAERTHILALNASMHAASAGEAGKGFAVVAEEVQRLAENARSATSEISSMVNNIRVETSDTVNVMNKLIAQVAEGTKMAEDSGQRMHETEAATRQLVSHVKSIAVNSMNQANLANKVRTRANLITESTQKTREQLEEQRLQTDELKNYALNLMERVNVFTLPEFRSEPRQHSIQQPTPLLPVVDATPVAANSQPSPNQIRLENIAKAQEEPIEQKKTA